MRRAPLAGEFMDLDRLDLKKLRAFQLVSKHETCGSPPAV